MMIRIQQGAPRPVERAMAILPVGLYCNAAVQKAKAGDCVIFESSWRRDKRRIVQLCRFRINSPEFTFMLRSVVGAQMTIAELMERWEAWAVVEGIGKDGFSREEALVVVVEPVNDVKE